MSLFATGYLGAFGRDSTYKATYYVSSEGRHTGGANYLLADGHVKWLRGDNVSSGETIVGNFPSPTCVTQETSNQDPGGCNPVAAGTGSSQPWAATWSPI